jgi:mRNA deadenylase 3'-5' endonuclease subunit Ccr4
MLQRLVSVAAASLAAVVARARAQRRAREWAAFEAAVAARTLPPPAAGAFRVVTYNILADGPYYALSENSAYCVDRAYVAAGARMPRVAAELRAYAADIVALQETQEHLMRGWLRDALPGFVELFNPRLTAAESSGRVPAPRDPLLSCGDTLLAHPARLELLVREVVPFHAVLPQLAQTWSLPAGSPAPSEAASAGAAARLPDGGPRGARAAAAAAADPWTSVGAGVLAATSRRYDGACLMLLRERSSGRLVCVANTHVYYHPARPDVKAVQALALAHAVAAFVARHAPAAAPVAVVLAGDFNSFARKPARDQWDVASALEWLDPAARHDASGAYLLLTTGRLAATHNDHPARRGSPAVPALESPLGALGSAYLTRNGAEPPITTRTLTFEGTLDFLFHSHDLRVDAALPLPFQTTRAAHGGATAAPAFRPCPNELWPSDHIALGADFSFVR